MKKFLEEYHNFFLYGICIIIFILSIYNIIINFKHATFLNEKVIVADSSNNYREFKNNVLIIENNLNSYPDSKIHKLLSKMHNYLKNDGVFRLFPNDKLSYPDLYSLNNYFRKIIDDAWLTNINEVEDVDMSYYSNYIDLLINNANYIDKELLNNSNYTYNYNNIIRDNINEEYNYIVDNYWKLSSLIVEISNKMGDSND